VDQTIDGAADPSRDALANLQHGFDGAKQLMKEAKILLAGDVPEGGGEAPATDAAQATRAPSSDTVQNPAGE
jgi:hypothetical protein